ncbi:MAG TPA: hypothetical protein PKA00_08285 [Saprospiraceae bacterium]|nr:hypothetical protein [Saprospiraceae bacterium]HMQ82892.1 hypothetical protein [Saprospiraceae bacterium]
MRIANPLYDTAFKYLMSNDRLARKVLSVILDKEVLSIELSQQELVKEDQERQFTMYRLDFKARICDASGREETVLIELQKSKLPTNELRFRTYLGHAYLQKKQEKGPDNQERELAWPIISIYIMGYNLPDIPVMAVKVDRCIMDISRREELKIQSDFIDLLTHVCYILQVRRLPQERRTRIEKFMTLFNQAWIKEENYILDLEEVPEEFKDIAEYMQSPLQDETFRNSLRLEEEVEMIFANQEARIKYLEQLTEKERKEKEKERRQKEKERRQKELAEAQAMEERLQKEKAQEDFLKMLQLLLNSGESLEEIANLTGRTLEELRAMLG